MACGIWAVTGWPSRTSYWGWFSEAASLPLRRWLYVIKCSSVFSNETSMVLANRNTSHVLIEKCCAILGAQGMSSVSAYLELVGSQLHISCRCFLSTSAVLPDVRKVLSLSATDWLTYYLVTFLSLQQKPNKMKAHKACSEKLVFNQGACRYCVHMYDLSSQHFLMCPISLLTTAVTSQLSPPTVAGEV